MEVTVGLGSGFDVLSGLLINQKVGFTIDPNQRGYVASVAYRDKRLSLFVIDGSENLDIITGKISDELQGLNTVIFYCIKPDGMPDHINALREFVVNYGGYCPKTPYELGAFLREEYCTGYRGRKVECRNCRLYPDNVSNSLSKDDQDVRDDFYESFFARSHMLVFCK